MKETRGKTATEIEIMYSGVSNKNILPIKKDSPYDKLINTDDANSSQPNKEVWDSSSIAPSIEPKDLSNIGEQETLETSIQTYND